MDAGDVRLRLRKSIAEFLPFEGFFLLLAQRLLLRDGWRDDDQLNNSGTAANRNGAREHQHSLAIIGAVGRNGAAWTGGVRIVGVQAARRNLSPKKSP